MIDLKVRGIDNSDDDDYDDDSYRTKSLVNLLIKIILAYSS
jgi:hypothetical protein